MTSLPISICFFTTTKGHYGIKNMYLDTLNHLNKLVPLSLFGARYAHIKITPEEEHIALEMTKELEARGFVVEHTIGSWGRGTSHQQGYLMDMKKASQSPVIHSQPYMLLLEDDSPFVSHYNSLENRLLKMVNVLEKDFSIVSTRFIRRVDFEGGVPILSSDIEHFFSPNFDFQPAILRTRDYYLANKIIEDNWLNISHLQCELIMRLALDTLSRSQNKHLVWLPDVGETYHLGTPEYQKTKASIGLT